MIDFSQFDSLIAMTMYFNNEDTCRQAIVETRWGIGENQDIVCPYFIADSITVPHARTESSSQICVEPSDCIASFFLEMPLSMHFVALILHNCFLKSAFFRNFGKNCRIPLYKGSLGD